MAHNENKRGQQDRTDRSDNWDKAESNTEQNAPARSGQGRSESGAGEEYDR